MSEAAEGSSSRISFEFIRRLEEKNSKTPPTYGGGGGDGPKDPIMEARVTALEEGMKDIKATLKEIRDGQQAAALKVAEQVGDTNTKFASLDGKFASLEGKLATITEASGGLRRDLEKLPTEYGVAKIMVFVIGGLGATALLIKTVWPMLSKAFG